MAVSEWDLGSELIPTRRFHHTVKLDDKKAGSKTDSESENNLIVVTGSTENFTNGQSEHYDLLRFENVRDFDRIDEKWCAAKGFKMIGEYKILLIVALSTAFLWTIFTAMRNEAVVLFCVGWFWAFSWKFSPMSVITTRAIKWTLEEFSEEIRGYFFTSPTIHDKSGSWRLVLRQVADEEANFGLIATEIPENIEYVVANIEISTTVDGSDTVPGMNDIKFIQKFEREGDCGYSTPVRLSFEQLKNHNLEIKCRIQFTRKILLSHKKNLFGEEVDTALNCPAISENGNIISENKFQYKMQGEPLSMILTGTELEGDSLSFMKHPETKVFFWKIPNFTKYLKNVEFWEIFSPKLLVHSHGFCSIWRLQLVELEGVFRIHMQLRGLPSGISKIRMRHLLELVDNCGECVAPKNCGSTIKYPEHLNLNDNRCCGPLYRRDAILERFLDKNDTLNVRISLYCEPKD